MGSKPTAADLHLLSIANSESKGRVEQRYAIAIEIAVDGIDRSNHVFRERTSTRDISGSGCGFAISVPLQVDDIVAISILSPDTGQPVDAKPTVCQVMHVREDAAGWYVGVWKLDPDAPWTEYMSKAVRANGKIADSPEGQRFLASAGSDEHSDGIRG